MPSQPPPGTMQGTGKQCHLSASVPQLSQVQKVTADGLSQAVRPRNVRGGRKVQLQGKGTPNPQNSNTVGGSNRQPC